MVATSMLCVLCNVDKKVTGMVTHLRKYYSPSDVRRGEKGKSRAPVFVLKFDRCRPLFDTPRHKLENGAFNGRSYEMRVTFQEILGQLPMVMMTSIDSSVVEGYSGPRQILKESLIMKIFTSPGGAPEERPLVDVGEKDALQTEKGTLESSSNNYDRAKKAIEETHEELHMADEHRLVENYETAEKSDQCDKKESDKASTEVVDDEQSDVSDCVSDFEENGDAPYVLMSGLQDVHTAEESEMRFGADRDYSYNWVDDPWSAYGARTRDESEYEAEMEKVQAEYEMEFELNRCNPHSFMNGYPSNGTQNENDHELEYRSDEENAFEVHGSYSGVNNVEGDETEKTGNDEASSGLYDEQCDVTLADEDDLKARSYNSYRGENSVEPSPGDGTEKTGNDEASSGLYDEESDVTDYSADGDDSYSSIVHSEYDMNIETDSEDSYRWMDGMEAFYGATLKIDHEKAEYERAQRKEMDIAHWIETVNKEMFPHLINNLENNAAVKESEVVGLVESLGDVQSAVIGEGEIDGVAYSDCSYTNGSQRDETVENENDYEDDSEETSGERDDVQSTDYADGISGDSHSRMQNGQPKTRDHETHMHRCCLADERQEMDVVHCAAATVNDQELLPDPNTAKVENNVTRGRMRRCLARFFAAARRFLQRYLPSCFRGRNGP